MSNPKASTSGIQLPSLQFTNKAASIPNTVTAALADEFTAFQIDPPRASNHVPANNAAPGMISYSNPEPQFIRGFSRNEQKAADWAEELNDQFLLTAHGIESIEEVEALFWDIKGARHEFKWETTVSQNPSPQSATSSKERLQAILNHLGLSSK